MPIKPVSGEIKSQELNDNFSYLDSLIKVGGGGSPRGVFATLNDLKNAYPNGDSGVYVVVQDGNWYYWNESAWVSGGEYIAAEWFYALTENGEPWEV